MDRASQPISLTAAVALPPPPELSADAFVDDDMEFRVCRPPTNGPHVLHVQDKLYFVLA